MTNTLAARLKEVIEHSLRFNFWEHMSVNDTRDALTNTLAAQLDAIIRSIEEDLETPANYVDSFMEGEINAQNVIIERLEEARAQLLDQ